MRPYITWVKDFSVYPQAGYEMVPFFRREYKEPEDFSITDYLCEKRRAEEEYVKESDENFSIDDLIEQLLEDE